MEELHTDVTRKPDQLGRSSVERKPWKQRQKDRQHETTADEIQIFEGKPALSPPLLASTPPDSGYVQIISEDDEHFFIPSKVVESFECVGVILRSDAKFLENIENIIRFPDIRPEVMESVLRFVFMDHLNREKAKMYWGMESPRLVFQFEVDSRLVMEIIHAAHFLGISSLLKVATQMVAHNFEGVPDVSSLPTDLAWCVAEQFSALDLFDAEERTDFRSLDLDTEMLWKKHSMRLLPDHPVVPVSPSISYPSYKEWNAVEGLPPTSWKSLYVSHSLQQLADKQDGGQNAAFFTEVSYRGQFAFSHTIRPMFWDWVMCAPGAWGLSLYVAQFPHLRSLSLAKIPLNKISTDGAVPYMMVGEILCNLPCLQHLDISDTGFTTEAAMLLSRSLPLHKSLQVLRLPSNRIRSTGFSAIAQSLANVRTLKLLDVSANGISPPMDYVTLKAVNLSSLEELLLTGNCKDKGDETCELCGNSCASESETYSRGCVDEQNGYKQDVSVVSEMPRCLKNLQLSHCDLVDSHMRTLVMSLSNYSSIQKLDLSDNSLSSLGAKVIFSWLKNNTSVRELSLANNRITASSSSALAETLVEHPCIVKISLRANFSFGEENLSEVIAASVAHGNSMTEQFFLDLRDTGICYATRGTLLRQLPQLGDYLQVLI